jgi:four helix bundle protein
MLVRTSFFSLLLKKRGKIMGKLYASDLSERLLKFSVDVTKQLGEIQGGKELDVIRHQLVKSATSIGANYQESQSTTRKEFPTKIRICVREALESLYWLRVMGALEVCDRTNLERLTRENEEIVKILKTILRKTSSILTELPTA